ncbi:hypothetical protein, conserved [Eimeria necatrix]|uniref:SET domain-containing protein n=1 Tax=Eimeria necatrix TaxID=51315 RepID=U6MHL9_9EIME|nr:hypothetical protein, conserved [Eimeria necatrix]CDJ63752.1 hypothetical protein, conserved [Eimeria necatrix]
MLFARLLRQASPVPEGLASLNAQAEAANHEQSLPRTHPGLREISPSFPVSDADLKTFVDDFEAGGETEQEEEQTPEETHELILLHQLLPDLLQSNRVKEAEDVVCRFLDRNPRNADGFALLAEVYSHQNMLAAACESLWGAVHNSPGNRMLLRLLHSTEEQFVLQQCQLPLSFLVKTLLVPRPPEDSASQDIHDSICSKEGAPVVVFRQGSHVTSLANRNLEPGDVVFRQRPFVLTPLILESGQIYTSCFHCLRSRNDPDTGFSCPISPHTCPFVFCSWQCLMRNSRIHAVECRAIPVLLAAAKEAQFSATTVLHLFRTLVKAGLERQSRMSAHQDKDMQRPPGDIVEQLLALNSYQAAVARGQPELYKQLVVLARRLQREFPEYMLLFLKEGELIDLILNIWQYSPLLTCPSVPSAAEGRNPDGAIGQVLAPAVSLLLHSCIPTCILCLEEDGQVAVKALTFIPIGGSLSISLEEDLYKSQRDRKHVMARPRVFGCGCIRCVDISEGGRLLRGIRCFSCVRGFLCPHKSRSLSSRLVAYSTASAASGLSKVSSLEYSRDPEAREEKAREKMISAGFNCIGAGFGTEREAGDPALVEEQWLCSSCGLDSTAASQRCRVLESEAEQQQAAAEKYLVAGAYIQARKEYTSLVRQYSTLLHPQHAVLFNAYTVLAGLLSSEPAADAPKASS